MGQRLVMTIKHNNKDLMKVYYHWSAYTISALAETKKFISSYNNYNHIKNIKLRCIRALENVGARLDGETEFNTFKVLFPKENILNDGLNRNNGLIALSSEGMKDIQYWSEGNLIIDLDNKTIDNLCCVSYNDLNDCLDDYCIDEKITDKDLLKTDLDLNDIKFDEINDSIDELLEIEKTTELPIFISKNGRYIGLIQ